MRQTVNLQANYPMKCKHCLTYMRLDHWDYRINLDGSVTGWSDYSCPECKAECRMNEGATPASSFIIWDKSGVRER